MPKESAETSNDVPLRRLVFAYWLISSVHRGTYGYPRCAEYTPPTITVEEAIDTFVGIKAACKKGWHRRHLATLTHDLLNQIIKG